MDNFNEKMLIETFGEDALRNFNEQALVFEMKKVKLSELHDLKEEASQVFKADIKIPDIIVCAGAGILMGCASALFKTTPISHNNLGKNPITKNPIYEVKPHETRTVIDYKTPKVSGSFQHRDLHRQLGPSHDIFRFKESISMLKGEQTDFKLWGSTLTEIMGTGNPQAGILRAKGMSLNDFINIGGFKIPDNPGSTLLHHWIADFFTKTSLPVPGSTLIADHSKDMAKLMYGMYDQGFNLKSVVANSLAFALLQIVIYSYTFLFKVLPASEFRFNNVSFKSFKNLLEEGWQYRSTNEFHIMMMMGHGSSFLADTIITTGSQNYMGLFQLNYASLIAFSKHLIQYSIKCYKENKELMNQVKEKTLEIEKIDNEWFDSFRSRFQSVSQNEDFIQFVDPEAIDFSRIQLTTEIEKRQSNHRRMQEALNQLRSIDGV
jgi:hypothetical protein